MVSNPSTQPTCPEEGLPPLNLSRAWCSVLTECPQTQGWEGGPDTLPTLAQSCPKAFLFLEIRLSIAQCQGRADPSFKWLFGVWPFQFKSQLHCSLVFCDYRQITYPLLGSVSSFVYCSPL